MRDHTKLLGYYELDYLFEPKVLSHVWVKEGDQEFFAEKVELFRDSDLHLKFKIQSLDVGSSVGSPKACRRGEFANLRTLTMKPLPNFSMQWTLSGAFTLSWRQDANTKNFIQKGFCSSIEYGAIDVVQDEQITYLVGAPQLHLSRLSKRSVRTEISILRQGKGHEKFPKWTNEAGEDGTSLDWCYLKTKFGEIILGKPYSENPISEFSPLYMHYVGWVPTEDQQQVLLGGLSFLLGKRLIQIGHTRINGNGEAPFCRAIDPHYLNVHKDLDKRGVPPTDLHPHRLFNEVLGTDILNAFIEKCAALDLDQVVWYIAIARSLPPGANLVVYFAALEGLVNAWAKSNPGAPELTIVSDEQFLDFFNEIDECLETKVVRNPAWGTIKKKIAHANRATGNRQMSAFFSAHDLEVGAFDQLVINSRHRFAHGGSFKGQNDRHVIMCGNGFESLIARCVLAAIGHKGTYIDYTSLEHPSRSLSKPLGWTILGLTE